MVTLKLDQIIREFQAVGPRERLELLADFAEGLPPIPPDRRPLRYRVHECQTLVFLWIGLDEEVIEICADVSSDAPTIRGFVGLFANLFSGARVDEVLAVKPMVLDQLGLVESLGIARLHGMRAILFRIKERVKMESARQRGS